MIGRHPCGFLKRGQIKTLVTKVLRMVRHQPTLKIDVKKIMDFSTVWDIFWMTPLTLLK